MVTPAYTPEDERTRAVFYTLMNALCRPSELQTLAISNTDESCESFSEAAVCIAETLFDRETRFFADNTQLSTKIAAKCGIPSSMNQAEYVFASEWNDSLMQELESLPLGDHLFPDRSATIFIRGTNQKDQVYTLQGPGIEGQNICHFGGIPEAFWDLRNAKRTYPIGWDIYVLTGNQILGIPRSTNITKTS